MRCEYNLMPRAYNIHSSSGVVMYYKSRERSLYPDMGDFPRWSPNGTILHYYSPTDYTECARRSEDEFAFLRSPISRCEQHKNYIIHEFFAPKYMHPTIAPPRRGVHGQIKLYIYC